MHISYTDAECGPGCPGICGSRGLGLDHRGETMKRLEAKRFSKKYHVREMTEKDIGELYAFCRTNPFFYEMGGQEVTKADIQRDMTLLPPGKDRDSKYYVGFFEGTHLTAVLDLIDGFPDSGTAYIGFFMVDGANSCRGIGTYIIEELCIALKHAGFRAVRLGYDKENPQAEHFWIKNSFGKINEADHPYGKMIVAERSL